jgi:molybdate transport system substrate-binding protein
MKHAFVPFLFLLGLLGCSSKTDGVRIFAAVSTKEAVEAIGRDFENQTGTPTLCTFAASSTLARQIEGGADADLFLSADQRWADHLADAGLVAQRRDLLANRLVVVTPADHPRHLKVLADLAGDEFPRLALALDPVPAGHYSRETLKKADVWPRVEKRIREAGDVRATLALVERDEADAGIVYSTDAKMSKKVHVALEIPEELHEPIRYPLVLLRRAGGSAKARAFYDFLGGETASAHFAAAGFQPAR